MNLEDLRAAQTRERATDGLQDLRDSFYGDVATYISELKERRDAAAAAADDPFGDPEVQELSDKIETATQVAEAIYERRMGKLVKQASLAAAGMPDEEDGLTDEEQELYDDLVDRIEANKSHVLDVISGEEPAGSAVADDTFETGGPDVGEASTESTGPDPSSTESQGTGSADASAAAAMGTGPTEDGDDSTVEPAPSRDGEPTDAIAEDLARVKGDEVSDGEQDTESTESDDELPDEGDAVTDGDVERSTIRVIDDVGEIFGVDERSYTLEAEDVVTLPEENAKPLVEKDAAEKLE
jgi:DNA replication factor GINS